MGFDSGDVPTLFVPDYEDGGLELWLEGLHSGLTAYEKPGTPRERARVHFLVLGDLDASVQRFRRLLDEEHDVTVFFDGQPGQSKIEVVFPETVWVACEFV